VTSSHRVGWFTRSSGRLYLRLSGWRVEGRIPEGGKHIACGPRVPILCAFLDYRRRVGGIAAVIQPTGDLAAEMDAIRACYAGITGKFPALDTPIWLLEEDQPAVA
jgi:hypothetical protein